MRLLWPTQSPILLVYAHNSPEDAVRVKRRALERAEERLCAGATVAEAIKLRAYLEAQTHPDFRFIEPETEGGWLKIDLIRDLNEWLFKSPLLGSCKIAIISEASRLNRQAANAFLKTLETLPAYSELILLTHQPALILATVRSRCYSVHLERLVSASHPIAAIPTPHQKPEVNTVTVPESAGPLFSAALPAITEDLQAFSRASRDLSALSQKWATLYPLPKVIQAFWQLLSQYNRAYAQAGRLLSQEAYWTLVDHLVQAQRSLELGTLNPKLLMETFILEYAAIINEYDN